RCRPTATGWPRDSGSAALRASLEPPFDRRSPRAPPGDDGRDDHHREPDEAGDRKSTRLNSSHGSISYAVFCLKKKKKNKTQNKPKKQEKKKTRVVHKI